MNKKSVLLFFLTLIIGYSVTHLVVIKKINNWISQNENITVKNTSLNLLFGNLSLEDIKFNDERYTTDTCVIESIQVKDFSFLDYLRKDEIKIDEIALNNAQLFLTTPPSKDSQSQNSTIFHISKISSENINVNYSTDKFTIQIRQGFGHLTDFANSNKNKFEQIKLSIEDMSYTPKKGRHRILAEKVKLNSKENIVQLASFLIKPRCSVDEWPSCYPKKKSRSTYTAKSIVGILDTNSIMSGIFLKELKIGKGLFQVISYLEMEPEDESRLFFMEKFSKIKIPINIPIIEVKDHKVEVLLKAQRIDTLHFEQVYATFNNVSNIQEVINKNNNLKVATLSKFMDSGLKVDFDFKIEDPIHAYTFILDLDPMPFTNLNKAVNYNTPLTIQEGKLQQLECIVSGSTQGSSGECTMAYDDLYVTIEDRKGKKKKILTNLFNFIIKDGTGRSGSMDPKTYTATLEREDTKGFFYHAHTVILEMIKDAMLPN